MKPEALEYYGEEFNKMLAQNLENYAEIFEGDNLMEMLASASG